MEHKLSHYQNRWSREAVVAAPSVNTARHDTVRQSAIFGGLLGVIVTLTGLIGIAGGLYFHNIDLSDALILMGVSAAGLALSGAGFGAYQLTRARERKLGVLTPTDIEVAPLSLSLPLMDALTAADTIRESRAYQDKWLADIDLDAAMWDLAQHVKTGTEIQRALNGAGENTDAATLAEGRAARVACTEHVTAAAARLTDLARRVQAFDHELGEPDRLATLEQARARRDRIQAQHRARLATATADVAAIAPAVDETTARIAGQLDAYTDRAAMATTNVL